MDKLLESFKTAGVIDEVRSLLHDNERILIDCEDESLSILITCILCLEGHDRDSTLCYFESHQQTRQGLVPRKFNKLKRQLSSYASQTDAKTLVADRLLERFCQDWAGDGSLSFVIPGTNKRILVKGRYLKVLLARWGAKSSAELRTSSHEKEQEGLS